MYSFHDYVIYYYYCIRLCDILLTLELLQRAHISGMLLEEWRAL